MSIFGAKTYLSMIYGFLGYWIGIGLLFLIKQSINLEDTTTMLKAVSLFMLVVVGGELAINIDESEKDIRRANIAIVSISLILFFLLMLKLIGLSPGEGKLTSHAATVLKIAIDNAYWAAAAPIFLYALLNIYVVYFRNSSNQQKDVAFRFFIFSDFVCSLPMIFVLAVAYYFRNADSGAVMPFVNGAMAMIIFVSNTSTKVVQEYFYG